MKKAFSWVLYDFANSFVFIAFLIYFPRWIVLEGGLSESWYNGTFVVGSLGLLVAAPIFGARADARGRGRRYLIWSTVGCALAYAAAIGAGASALPLVAAAAFTVGNFCYQLAFVFYNPLLAAVSTAENRGRVSGLGYLANYAGQIAGLAVAAPFAAGTISLGVNPLLGALVPAALIFIVLATPLMRRADLFAAAAPAALGTWRSVRAVFALPGAPLFLLSFFLFSDAITTFLNNFSVFAAKVHGMGTSGTTALTAGAILAAAVGALVFGRISDRFSARAVLLWILGAWVPGLVAVAYAPSAFWFSVMGGLLGFLIGGTMSISRRVFAEMVPAPLANGAFGLYAISERAATLVGPIAWSLAIGLSGHRTAILVLAAFQLASFLAMLKVRPAAPVSPLLQNSV